MNKKRLLKRWMYLLPALALTAGSFASAQVTAAGLSGSGLGAFISFGGLRTHVINYTFNALGVDGGVYVQRSPWMGLELRAASYPIHARFSQSPFTAGYRMEVREPGPRNMHLSGYVGGGMSRSVDAGPHYVSLPAQWSPCWQVSQAISVDMGAWRWKAYEGTFTQTFTPQRTLRGLSLTTGVVYTFNRVRRQL